MSASPFALLRSSVLSVCSVALLSVLVACGSDDSTGSDPPPSGGPGNSWARLALMVALQAPIREAVPAWSSAIARCRRPPGGALEEP